jgi:hypothetical protein
MPTFSDPNPAAEPAGAAPASEPAAPAAQPAEPAAPAAVHPAWDKALEGMPDLWANRIKEQVRTTETEHQKAIEQARTSSVPDSWRDLYSQAEQAGLTPEQFIDAYNGQQTLYEQLRTDPDQFLEDMRTEIDRQVAAGVLTRAQGREAHAAANQAAANAEDLLTPEQIELQQLRERLDQRDQQEQTFAQQQQQQQILEQAEQEGASFVQTVHDAFDGDPQLAGASAVTRQTVAQIAAGLLDADSTGRLSYEQAVQAGMNQLRESVGLQQLSFPGQQQNAAQPNAAAAIGGGSSGFQNQQPTTFDLKTQEGRDARDQALVAQIEAMNAQANQG